MVTIKAKSPPASQTRCMYSQALALQTTSSSSLQMNICPHRAIELGVLLFLQGVRLSDRGVAVGGLTATRLVSTHQVKRHGNRMSVSPGDSQWQAALMGMDRRTGGETSRQQGVKHRPWPLSLRQHPDSHDSLYGLSWTTLPMIL